MNKVFLFGLIGAWLNRNEKGFRQKDVRFYIELISDWMESSEKFKLYKIQNTQMMRFLDGLVQKDWLIKKSGPIYFFKDKHFMSLMKELFNVEEKDSFELFLLQYHFASLYKNIIYELLYRRGVELSNGERIDLEMLLSTKHLKNKQAEKINKEILLLEKRISDVKKMTLFSEEKLKKMHPLDVVKELEKTNPYQLQYYQSMTQTFKEILPEIITLELTIHSEKRISTIWEPLKKDLQNKLELLEKLPNFN